MYTIENETNTRIQRIEKEIPNYPTTTITTTDIVVDGFLYQLQLTSDSFVWNLRYLQLRNGTLVSFKPVDDTIILESIPSLEAKGYLVQYNTANEFAFYSFTLFSSGFSLTFTTLTEDYTKYWVNALNAACKRPPALNPHPPFASLSHSQKIFSGSALPHPFSSLRFDCSVGIAKVVDSWLESKSEIDPIREAFSSFEDILQYRYSSKNIAFLFDFAITRQFNKMRTLLISSRKNTITKHRYDYFSAEDLCLFLCIIMGEEEGVNILLKESNLELTKHMGGFTPLLLAIAENKPNITKLLVDNSHDPNELKKLIKQKDPLENSKEEYLANLSSFLNATRKVDPHRDVSLPSLSPQSPPNFYIPSPIPISPLDAPSPPHFPIIQPSSPSVLDLRLLQLVASFQIPRSSILSVVQSLLNIPKVQTCPEPSATVVTETDAYRTLRVSGLNPESKYILHHKMLKLNAHSSELQVSNKGEAIADANGTATWKIRSYLVCDIEMHVGGETCNYKPFTCRFTSRKKGGEKTKPSDLDIHVMASVV